MFNISVGTLSTCGHHVFHDFYVTYAKIISFDVITFNNVFFFLQNALLPLYIF